MKRRDLLKAIAAAAAGKILLPGGSQAESSTDNQLAHLPKCPPGKIRFHLLGSAAGLREPRPFCSCNACKVAHTKGGRHWRTRTSMNIYLPGQGPKNVKYKVDFTPDTYYHSDKYGLDHTHLEHLFITHIHADHFDPDYLALRSRASSGTNSLTPLKVYGPVDVENLLKRKIPDLDNCRMTFHRINPFEAAQAGQLSVFPLRGSHAGITLNYIVQIQGLTVLLGWDTGPWSEKTWQAASKFRFDAVFHECTFPDPGSGADGRVHHNFDTFLEMKKRMEDSGLVKLNAPFITNHMVNCGRLDYDQAQEVFTPHGVTVGYDGLLLEL